MKRKNIPLLIFAFISIVFCESIVEDDYEDAEDAEEMEAAVVPDRVVYLMPNLRLPDIATFRAQAYAAQNCYRAAHGAAPLSRSTQLESYAQSWADHLASSNAFEHSKGKYGENLYANSNPRMDGTDAITAWYAEGRNYNYNANSGSSATGHFTQVVWKGSKSGGIAFSTSSKWTIVVAEYDPPGNYLGRYRENVGQPTGSTRNCTSAGLGSGDGGPQGSGGGMPGMMPAPSAEPDYNMGPPAPTARPPPRPPGRPPNEPPPDENPEEPPQRPPMRPPQGRPPQGRPPQGRPPQGRPPQGRPPQGRPPYGRPPQGRPPSGYRPPGRPPNRPPYGPYNSPVPVEEDGPVEPIEIVDSIDTMGFIGALPIPPCEGWLCKVKTVKIENVSKNTTTYSFNNK